MMTNLTPFFAMSLVPSKRLSKDYMNTPRRTGRISKLPSDSFTIMSRWRSSIRRRIWSLSSRKGKPNPSKLSLTTMTISANSFILEDGSTNTTRSLRSNISGIFGKGSTNPQMMPREPDVSKQSQTFTLYTISFNQDYCTENHIWNVNQFDDDASSDDNDRTSSDEVSDSKDEEEMAQLL